MKDFMKKNEWLVSLLVYSISTFFFGSSNAELNFKQFSFSQVQLVFVYKQVNGNPVLFETIQFIINTVSMSKTDLFQTIQFSISTQFSSI